MRMTVACLRRYPVKSMGGEALASAELDPSGLVGDRRYAVVDEDGFLASGKHTRRFRRRDAVFRYAARTTDTADVLVTNGRQEWRVGDEGLVDDLSSAMNARVTVEADRAAAHQDEAAVSLVSTATLEWCAARWGIGADPRRLRTNLVITAAEPFAEEAWEGRELAIGDGVRLRITRRIPRCRMIDVDQDGAVAEGRWLTRLGAERDTRIGVYAEVVGTGTIRTGDLVSPC
ncbi:MOSC domain-containing protein [Aeromicrobium phragmitis]|uniref:MOSC domain-containing protein n=1 Tax=Aeromicrobium phragmitis TaxID=2478914 RepID=A0A3L8PJ20_9ACTN|nr:MOSC N-terminal beta barrel domain-containing protein [Aeromicrobium phragmitis]RLV54749.1 MOSC domain-containing protein [Aeromicrobium phragmitis]